MAVEFSVLGVHAYFSVAKRVARLALRPMPEYRPRRSSPAALVRVLLLG